MATHNKPKVVVVGAGMAGLSAAAELCKSGQFEVTVLEAMDRPGGRIHTYSGFGSSIIELGANWIHGTKGNPVFQLAEKHNLIYEDSSSSSSGSSDEEEATWHSYLSGDDNHECWMENGKQVKRKRAQDAARLFKSILDKVERLEPEKRNGFRTFDEYARTAYEQELRQHGITHQEKLEQYWLVFNSCVRMECMDMGTNSAHDISMRHYLDYEAFEGDYYTCLGERGYVSVIEQILADIPSTNVHFNSPVAQIQYGTDTSEGDLEKGVVVTCEDGRAFACCHVIVTSSVGFLKANHETFFKPPLPDDKQEVLQILQSGTVNKIFLKFEKPFWKRKEDYGINFLWNPAPKDETEDEAKKVFYRQLCGFDVEEKNDDILLGWVFGKGAEYMETLSDEEIGKRCVALLRKFYSKTSIPEPTKVLCTRWHSNPYTRGSYGAYLPLAGTGNEYKIMSTPVFDNNKVPLLLFAGEALHKKFQSTTHGAMVTGRDQAQTLIKYNSRKK